MAKAPAEIRSLARAHTGKAIKTLVGIMNQKKAPPSARVAAAQALLDRGWGKPNQPMEHKGEISHSYVARMPEVPKTADEWQRQYAPTTTH